MFRNRLIVINLLIALCSGFAADAALAASTSRASLAVHATVLPWMKINAVQHVKTFQVTDEDIRRGYADLSSAVTVSYATNISGVLSVAIDTMGPERIYVRQAGSMSQEIALPTVATAVPANVSLSLRVVLPNDTVAGLYPLNLAIVPTVM